MKELLTTALILLLTISLTGQKLFTQNAIKNYEISLSRGLTYISNFDEAILTSGIEISGRVWKRLEIGFDVKYGEALYENNIGEFIFSTNANAYLNLTPKSKVQDLRLGLSASYCYFQEPASEYTYMQTEFGSRSSSRRGQALDQLLGAGFILDYKVTLKEYITIGVKSFINGYPLQAVTGGLMLTSGVRF